MINICKKGLLRCLVSRQQYGFIALQNYATFGIRDILYETSDEAGTLSIRFAKHVALERQKVCDQVSTEVKYSDYFPISDLRYFDKELRKTPKDQLAAVITYAFTYRSNADPSKFAIILNELDRHAVNNVEEMNADTILRTLYAFLFLIPNWMTRLDFYGPAMKRLFDEFQKSNDKSKEQFVQLCFYMGLSKKQTKFNVNKMVETLLNEQLKVYLKELSTLDMALVSNAAYKTSTVVKDKEFDERLIEEALGIARTTDGDDALLVTFIKSMRLQRLHSLAVCEYITNICRNPAILEQLQAKGKVHLFAYLADNLWDSKECTQPLIESITGHITLARRRDSTQAQNMRGKDIGTFLWACAQLNCSLSSLQLRTIENSLIEKLQDNEFNYFTDQLVDACLSLWILGFKPKELLQAAVKLKSESSARRHQPKVDSRLTVLLSAAQIEESAWCSTVVKGFESFKPSAKVPAYLLNNHDIPYQDILSQILSEESVAAANISCPVNGINIPGILVKFSQPVDNEMFLEFLTPAQMLHFSKEPVGILRLKLRLLQAKGYKVKVVSSKMF